MLKQLKQVTLLGILVAFVAGCNTVEGFGRDVEKLGDKIERKAAQKRNY
ncbi:MAG TPA: entericidin A/B family lipoprotein [Burkholderiales bacterium]|nr:entericidin A/B family lipoprotein [Burkholderiales bacterium]